MPMRSTSKPFSVSPSASTFPAEMLSVEGDVDVRRDDHDEVADPEPRLDSLPVEGQAGRSEVDRQLPDPVLERHEVVLRPWRLDSVTDALVPEVGLDEERGDPYEDEEDPDQGQQAVATGRERDDDAHEDEQDADRDAVGEIEDVGDGEEPECAGDEQDEAEPRAAAHRRARTRTTAPTAISAIGQMYFQARKSDQISSARKNAPRTTKARPRATAPPVRSRAGAAAALVASGVPGSGASGIAIQPMA